MPELAEVEFFRKQWDVGRKQKILAIHLHEGKRIHRGVHLETLRKTLTGAALLDSKTHGKQMFFRFSNDAWLGIHLGMTGKLEALPANSEPFVHARHEHLVLRVAKWNLVFSDPRQFGRILFHVGKDAPPWGTDLPPELVSPQFTLALMEGFLRRHRSAPLKAVLLMQDGFPGVGNWMADEILWQAGLHPRRLAGKLNPVETRKLYRVVKSVCRTAMRTISVDYGDPPRSWLFRHRWKSGGHCPKDGSLLKRATVGGRTTCWCPVCQKGK